ncbi:MAG: MATE family efflux transporter [Lachnospiraceae bacterium]|nr:MATE family efflux transporter [Lachnospiraceae bacterium]
MKNLTHGKPLKLILLFAIPLFIGQLFQLFYSLVDTRIVGSILGDEALAAVGATSSLSEMLLSLLNGLTNGFALIIAAFFGADDTKNMKKAVGGTVLLGVISSICISVVCLLFLSPILRFMNVSDDLMPQAKSYISIILAGLLAATLYNVCAAILRAIGDSFTPLIFLIISTFLNIFLDYAFIRYLQMGVAGAAFATVISQALSAFMCFLYMRKKYPSLTLAKEDFSIPAEIYRRLLATGLSMGFMVSFVNLGSVALQTAINTFGQNTIVAHTAARKVTSIFMLPFSVLGATLATFCSQNLGAGKYSRIKTGVRDTLLVTFAWCAVVIAAAYTISPILIRLITASTEKEVIDTATLYLKVNTAFYFVPAVICLFRNSMQGFGDNKTPVFSSTLELVGKVVIAFLLAPAIGYMGIIVSEPIVWIIMVIPLIVNMVRSPILRKPDAD